MQEDIFVARLALGDEQAALREIQFRDLATREKLSLLRLKLYLKLHAGQVEKLLELMNQFVNEFPASTNRVRIEYEMADLSFEAAERAWLEVRDVARENATQVAKKWSDVRRNQALGREIAGRLLRQKGAGLETQDYLHLWQDYLLSYYIQGDYSGLAAQTAVLLADAEVGSLGWVMGKVNEGVVLACSDPPRSREAGELFDQVMSLGFRNKPAYDQWITCAAKWHVCLALRDGNRAEAEATAHWVENSSCSKTLKQDFLRVYRSLIGNSE
ncbi:MAG: hypothetical protein N2379_05305 [Verrucomicrobiae bacterium]|nr:hypothetical protein [Verrucomicrobiae bacterium]